MPVEKTRRSAGIYLLFALLNLATIAMSLVLSHRTQQAFAGRIDSDKQLAEAVSRFDALSETIKALDTPLSVFDRNNPAAIRGQFIDACNSVQHDAAFQDLGPQLRDASLHLASLRSTGLDLLDQFAQGNVRGAATAVTQFDKQQEELLSNIEEAEDSLRTQQLEGFRQEVLASQKLRAQRNYLTIFLLLMVIASAAYGWRTIHDSITAQEREQYLAALRRTTAMRDTILNSVTDGVCGINDDGQVIFINAPGASLLGEEDAARLFDRDARDRRTTINDVPIEYSASSMNGEGIVVTFRDIRERVAVEKLKDEFVSTVTHELRTPLTSIRGSLGLLASGKLGVLPEKGKRLLDIASANTERLVRLINDILDIERMESGRITIVKSACDTRAVAMQAIEVVRPLAERAGIALEAEVPSLPLLADGDRVVQTLTNLLGNAVKFSDAGTTIRVRAAREDRNIRFSVSDEGRGIPEDKRGAIFERFQQVDSSDAREKAGSGLGLAICRSIVRQHGGDIGVESELGKGSTFFFTIPAEAESISASKSILICDGDADERSAMGAILTARGYEVRETSDSIALADAVAAQPPDAILFDVATVAETGDLESFGDIPIAIVASPFNEETLASAIQSAFRKQKRRPRVMLVEDDADLARVIAASFERHGIETVHAADGQSALQLASSADPDLLVLDLILPDLDGFAVVEALRHQHDWGTRPLVVYSALEPTPAERARLTLGQTEFMTKCRVTPAEFEERVAMLVEQLTNRKEALPNVA